MFNPNGRDVPSPPPPPPTVVVRGKSLQRMDSTFIKIGDFVDIPGCPGYAMNPWGYVLSKARYSNQGGDRAAVWLKESLIHPCIIKDKYWAVCLVVNRKSHMYYVHKLHAETFLGPCPEGYKVKVDPNYLTTRLVSYLSHVPTARGLAEQKRRDRAKGLVETPKPIHRPRRYMTMVDQLIAAAEASAKASSESDSVVQPGGDPVDTPTADNPTSSESQINVKEGGGS